jgi:lysozyme
MTLIEQLKADEGLQLTPYNDSRGNLTIGYGHNLGAGIPKFVAELLLTSDLTAATRDAQTFPQFASLSVPRQEVLIQMVFNLGLVKVHTFSHMLRALTKGDYQGVATEMLASDWHKEVGARAERLAAQMVQG